MFFVVLLHSYGQGGLLNNPNLTSSNYRLALIMEIIAYCAVDVFALISGYVSYKEIEKLDEKRLSKYLNLRLLAYFAFTY